MAKKTFCSNCSEEVTGKKFCSKCGTKVEISEKKDQNTDTNDVYEVECTNCGITLISVSGDLLPICPSCKSHGTIQEKKDLKDEKKSKKKELKTQSKKSPTTAARTSRVLPLDVLEDIQRKKIQRELASENSGCLGVLLIGFILAISLVSI